MSRAVQSEWRLRAKALIAEITRNIPAEALIEDRKKALWGKGWPAHQGTVWGRKMWGSEVRKYLARYGDRMAYSAGPQWQWPEHVHFPFRGESSDA